MQLRYTPTARPSRRHPRNRALATCAIAAMTTFGVGGCGDSGHTTALPLSAYVVRRGEQPGFHQVRTPTYLKTPAGFDAGSPSAAADNRQLARAGFRRAIALHTATTSGGQGISNVVELGSPADANQQQSAFVRQTRAVMSSRGPAPSRFTVTTVPGAVGLADNIAANVIYVEGRCLLVVGDETRSRSPRDPAVTGAKAVYQRTHAHSGACSN